MEVDGPIYKTELTPRAELTVGLDFARIGLQLPPGIAFQFNV